MDEQDHLHDERRTRKLYRSPRSQNAQSNRQTTRNPQDSAHIPEIGRLTSSLTLPKVSFDARPMGASTSPARLAARQDSAALGLLRAPASNTRSGHADNTRFRSRMQSMPTRGGAPVPLSDANLGSRISSTAIEPPRGIEATRRLCEQQTNPPEHHRQNPGESEQEYTPHDWAVRLAFAFPKDPQTSEMPKQFVTCLRKLNNHISSLPTAEGRCNFRYRLEADESFTRTIERSEKHLSGFVQVRKEMETYRDDKEDDM